MMESVASEPTSFEPFGSRGRNPGEEFCDREYSLELRQEGDPGADYGARCIRRCRKITSGVGTALAFSYSCF
jgi:hypothetical protein